MMTECATVMVLLTCLAGPGVGPVADTAAPLPLGEAVALAVATHPLVEAAGERARAAEAEAGRSRASLWPSLGLTGVGTRYQEPMVVAPLHGFDVRSPPEFDETLYQGHAGLEYTVFDGGARRSRIRASAAQASAAAAAAAATRDEVVAEAVSAYLSALTARAVLAAHAQQAEALEAERERARLLFAEGKSARIAVLRGDAALSEARAGLEAAREELRLALQRLARVTGLAGDRVTAGSLVDVGPVGGSLPAREALLDAALEANPGLRARRERAAAADLAVGAARAAFLPRVEFSGRYSAFGSPSTDPALEWQTGLQVSYPVFAGGARRRAVELAAASARASAAEVRAAERSVADAVDAARAAYRSARARVEALEAAVEQSREVVRIEALALEAGAGVQTDYLRSQAALLRARAGLAEARHAVVQARVRLAQVVGELDEAWLAERMEGANE